MKSFNLNFINSSLIPIHIEGCDLSGKTSLYKNLWLDIQKNNGYNIVLNDRSYMSILVYGLYYNRFSEEEKSLITNYFIEFLNNNVIFYIKTDEKIIRKRYNIRGDDLRKLDEILSVKDIYNGLSEKFSSHSNFYIINYKDEDDDNAFYKTILNTIDSIFNRDIIEKINGASINVKSFGCFNNSTREIKNYSILHNISIEKFDQELLLLRKNSSSSNIDERFVELENDSYDFQFSKWNKKIESILSGYYGKETISSRKFVFTDDECISFVHAYIYKNIIYLNAHWRSSDINKLNNDIYSIYFMCMLFMNKIRKHSKKDTQIMGINMRLFFDSLHSYCK